jgi:hypothetical protein
MSPKPACYDLGVVQADDRRLLDASCKVGDVVALMPRLADGESALTRTPRGSCGSSLSIDALKFNDIRWLRTLFRLRQLPRSILTYRTASYLASHVHLACAHNAVTRENPRIWIRIVHKNTHHT